MGINMPLSRDKMREYQRERRARMKGPPITQAEEFEEELGIQIEWLERRVEVLEAAVEGLSMDR